MKKHLHFLILFVIFNTFSFAQTKQLTMEQAVVGQYRELGAQRIYYLSWQPGTENYSYFDPTTFKYKTGNAKSKSDSDLFLLSDINTALKAKSLAEQTFSIKVDWFSNQSLSFMSDSSYVIYNLKTKKIDKVIASYAAAENHSLHPKTGNVAFTLENNLYYSSEKGIEAISQEKDKGIVFGKTVHRNEFGISGGIFWSPSGKYIAFYRMDETMVTDYPLVDITQRVATVKNTKYPMAGMASHHVTVGVYNTESKTIQYLNTGEPKEQFLTNITWSPDETSLYIAVLNREQNHMWFNQYSINSGDKVKTLFEETNPKYVEPLHPALFLNTRKNEFIWQSQRDGFNHLYLYNTEGKLLSQLTKCSPETGEWIVTELSGIDSKDEYVYFQSTMGSPLENHACRVNISNQKNEKLSTIEGEHFIVYNDAYTQFSDAYSNLQTPNVYQICNNTGKSLKTILTSYNPLINYNLPKLSFITITASDGKTKLYGRYIEPLNIDATKKHPAIIYVYGGPHAQMVTNSWQGGAPLWEFLMAQKGYAVLVIDNRGSMNRGFEFESAIHRNLGELEAEDQMKGVEYLKSLGYIDMNRIGVHGWSYGGFMTTNLMTKYNDVFKVGVAGGPVMDWSLYEVMYGERYMDMPQENPDGYKNANLTLRTSQLKGKLLLIHGYIDDVVVPQHSISFIENCIKNKKHVDFFIYPTHEHNVRGKDRVHLMEKVTEYFDTWLK